MVNNVLVIGGGASGIMASYAAAKNGANVTLIEKNEKLGKKIYITGKGRCNVTNACEDQDFFTNVVSNPKFLYSAYYTFNNDMLMSLIEENGCPLKVERGNRVFPVSDHSYDILDALKRMLKKAGVNVLLNENVLSIENKVVYTDKNTYYPDKIIIATGGISYTSTGSTGDGYKWASLLGHSIVNPHGALIPFECSEAYCKDMQGLSLKNVSVMLLEDKNSKKPIYEGFGEMLFTHFGVSGPLILTASSKYAKKYGTENKKVYLLIDLKPALSKDMLDARILRDFDEAKNKAIKNVLGKLLPSKMVPVVIDVCKIDPEKRINEITANERNMLVDVIKAFPLTVTGTRPVNEAIITQGGVNVKEINPQTMESKLNEGVYFVGEVLDLDAYTGGFNLQIAFSTGYLAGLSASE